MAKLPKLKIVTRIGEPGKGKAIEGIFAGVFKDEAPSPVLKYLDQFCPVKIKDLLASGEISGNFKEFHVIHLGPQAPIDRIVLIGLGDRKDFSRDTVRSTCAKAARTLRKLRCKSMAVVASSFGDLESEIVGEAVAEGVVLGLYKFQKMTKKAPKANHLQELMFFCDDKKQEKAVKAGIKSGTALAEATNMARVLASTPPNFCVPKDLVAVAKDIAKRNKTVSCKVFNEAALKKMGAGGILAVGQGSKNESFMIDLHYKCGVKDAMTIALVGKGVTFDTGGISIKPSSGMHMMKYDMGGSAAVLGAMDAIATLGLPVNVHGIVPTAENMPDGASYKPGDVLKMLSGHYVEVLNTDAEGRLLLADGIHYATTKKPDFIIDIATLTGHIILALGHSASGLFTNRDNLPDWIIEAGEAYNEIFWKMPLFPEYQIHLTSTVADFTNDGGRPAGASSAAKFLQNFTGDTPWAHLDIAGTGWIEESTILYVHKPYLPQRGATGFGVRTLASLIRNIGEKSKTKTGRAELRKQLKAS